MNRLSDVTTASMESSKARLTQDECTPTDFAEPSRRNRWANSALAYLWEAREAARKIAAFTRDRKLQAFKADARLRSAVERQEVAPMGAPLPGGAE